MALTEPTIYLKTNLRFLRKIFRVSQEELALNVNKRSTTISNWEGGVSEPDAKELAIICQYFGISIDSFVLADMAKNNLITDQDVNEFRRKNNLNHNVNPNLIGKKQRDYDTNEHTQTVANEVDVTGSWAILNALRGIEQKVDAVRDNTEKLLKKKP